MVKEHEIQGPEIVPNELEDKIYIRNEDGELVKLDIPDDAEEKDGDK